MKSIFIIGDSISIQYGPYLEKNVTSFLKYSRKAGEEEALKNLDIPAGANGGNSNLVFNYLKHKVNSNELTADFILFNCGLHDIKVDNLTKEYQVSLPDYANNLNAILELLKTKTIKPIWIRTTPVVDGRHSAEGTTFDRTEKDCHEYNKRADSIMNENNIPIIDLFTFTKRFGDEAYCDHVHFHESVREKQAGFISDWLKEFLKIN
ncbi:MAG: lipase [Planctomycetota bacterium]|nr:MAG: lipase [Planctomycetota bacterium]